MAWTPTIRDGEIQSKGIIGQVKAETNISGYDDIIQEERLIMWYNESCQSLAMKLVGDGININHSMLNYAAAKTGSAPDEYLDITEHQDLIFKVVSVYEKDASEPFLLGTKIPRLPGLWRKHSLRDDDIFWYVWYISDETTPLYEIRFIAGSSVTIANDYQVLLYLYPDREGIGTDEGYLKDGESSTDTVDIQFPRDYHRFVIEKMKSKVYFTLNAHQKTRGQFSNELRESILNAQKEYTEALLQLANPDVSPDTIPQR